jgi:hypothetical protein
MLTPGKNKVAVVVHPVGEKVRNIYSKFSYKSSKYRKNYTYAMIQDIRNSQPHLLSEFGRCIGTTLVGFTPALDFPLFRDSNFSSRSVWRK